MHDSNSVHDSNDAGAPATARAHSNIGLIKYWGKRDAGLNIPAAGSISITLDALATETSVAFRDGLAEDEFRLNGVRFPAGRVTRFLDLVRTAAGQERHAIVTSTNNFPTGAGLASSASGFAALAVAAASAAGLALDERELSGLARRGSGSAARSIYGGYVELHAGSAPDGSDSVATQLLAPHEWPLSVVVAITDPGTKAVDSTTGMRASAAASVFYDTWVDTAEADLAGMRAAIGARDFSALGELSEYSCLKLHAVMLSTRPALAYWNAGTVAAMHAVRELRASGVEVYFTIDAGPQLKALCAPDAAGAVAAALASVAGVVDVRVSGLGGGTVRLD